MRRQLAAVVAAAIVGAVAGGALAGSAPTAPPVAGIDVITGKRLSLADYRGRPVVINFWGSWCGGCKTEASDLLAFSRGHPKLALLGIDAEDSKPGARAFYLHYGFHHPSIFDPQDVLVHRLGVIGFPTTLFLDRRHRIVASVLGAGTLARFDAALRVATRP